jgi:hypothetical protein
MEIENVVKYAEKFSKEFQRFLTPDNSFYLNTRGIASNALSVNIPQHLTLIESGDPSGTNVKWDEGNKAVTQVKFRTKPLVIEDWDEFYTSQSMRRDALESFKYWADTQVGNFAAYKFAENTTIPTTGSPRASSLIGSTASVQAIEKADMLNVRKALAKANLPGKWFGLCDAEAISDLLNISEFTTSDKIAMQSKLVSGQFADILGIRIFERNPSLGANVAYTNVPAKSDVYGVDGVADAVAITDTSAAGIFWINSALYHNKGINKMYINKGDANAQGDVLSMLMGYGVDPIRTDKAGLVVLREDTV